MGGFGLAALNFRSRSDPVVAQDAATPSPVASPAVDPDLFTLYGQRGTTLEGWPIEIVLATPEFLRLSGREADIATFDAEKSLMVLTSRRHMGALTGSDDAFTLTLRIDGVELVVPAEHRLLRDEDGTRDDAFIFDSTSPVVTAENHLLEILLPVSGGSAPISFMWITPIVSIASPSTPAAAAEAAPDSSSDPMVDILETVAPSEEFEVC